MFNQVLASAQEILRKTFGMELVELQSRPEPDKEANEKGAKQPEGTGLKKRGVRTDWTN